MKTLYLLMSAAAVAFTASAAPTAIQNGSLREFAPVKKEAGKQSVVKMNKINDREAVAPATRAGIESLEGTWEVWFGDFYFQDSVGETMNLFEVTTDADGYVYFDDPTGYDLPFVGQYNESNSTISFSKYPLGELERYYVQQEAFEYNWNTDDLDPINAITGMYDASAGLIDFAPDQALAWMAYSDANYTKLAGYMQIYDLLEFDKTGVVPGDEGSWKEIGLAVFQDGWVLPAFSFDQTDRANWYEVPLEQNENVPSQYRLVDPYHLGPAAEYNTSNTKGYITFDVSDPDHVLFLKSDAGFALPSFGITRFYCYNQLGSLYETFYLQGMTVADIIAEYGADIPFTTFKDGVVSLSGANTSEGYLYDANFGYQAAQAGGYQWSYEDGSTPNMVASITFPSAGVESIFGSDNSEPVYYNLQGVRIASPEKGQLVIERRGNKAIKVVK